MLTEFKLQRKYKELVYLVNVTVFCFCQGKATFSLELRWNRKDSKAGTLDSLHLSEIMTAKTYVQFY